MTIKMKHIFTEREADVHLDSVKEYISGGFIMLEWYDQVKNGLNNQGGKQKSKQEIIELIEAKTGENVDGRTSLENLQAMAAELDIEV